MNIECLVLSGGGHVGFIELGEAYYLEQQKIWDKTKLKSIYATSAGAILAVLIALDLDWETINDYMILRPWDKVCEIKVDNILNLLDTKGIYGEEIFIQFLKPLLDALDYSIDITLEEFYEKTKIELNFLSFNISLYESILLNHSTFPTLPLYKALHMTSCIPIIFKPVEWNEEMYIDGGITCNYPIEHALKKYDKENILGFFFIINKTNYTVQKETSMLNYLFSIFVVNIFKNYQMNNLIENEIVYDKQEDIQNFELFDCVQSIEKRKYLFDKGIENAKLFIENKK